MVDGIGRMAGGDLLWVWGGGRGLPWGMKEVAGGREWGVGGVRLR